MHASRQLGVRYVDGVTLNEVPYPLGYIDRRNLPIGERNGIAIDCGTSVGLESYLEVEGRLDERWRRWQDDLDLGARGRTAPTPLKTIRIVGIGGLLSGDELHRVCC